MRTVTLAEPSGFKGFLYQLLLSSLTYLSGKKTDVMNFLLFAQSD